MSLPSDDQLIREVDEDLRRERLEALWKRHGNTGTLVLVVIVAALLSFTLWDQSRRAERAAVAMELRTLQPVAPGEAEAGDPLARAARMAELAAGADADQVPVILTLRAFTLAQANRTEDAVAAWRGLALDPAMPAAYRQQAAIRAAWLMLDQGQAAEIEPVLAPALAGPAAIAALARETQALAALELGRQEVAAALLRDLNADPQTPEALRVRARYLLRSEGLAETAAADRTVTPDVAATAGTQAAGDAVPVGADAGADTADGDPAEGSAPAGGAPAAEAPALAPDADTPAAEAPAPDADTPAAEAPALAPDADTPAAPAPALAPDSDPPAAEVTALAPDTDAPAAEAPALAADTGTPAAEAPALAPAAADGPAQAAPEGTP